MRLAILGGSFNPIHIGHLYLADTALSALGFDRLLLVPAFISPFKRDAETAPAADRLDMILASIPADPRIGVDDTELRREGVSFTIDTVNEIIERYRPEGKPALILGGDLAADFHSWKNAGEIAEKTGIVIAQRGEASPLAPAPPGRVFRHPPLRASGGSPAFPYPHTVLENEILNVSSAMIREKIASGGAWRSLVPQGARFIIEERGLYRMPPGGQTGKALVAAVEEAARAALKPSRFLHSRNTALMACDLARRFGLDPEAAYLAGAAHDLGKALNDGEIAALAERYGPAGAAERNNPALLHGKAAAVLLRERFGIHNRDILEAAAVHTTGAGTGGAAPSPLAMAVYAADKIEFSRRGVDPALREQAAGQGGTETNGGGVAPGLERLFFAVLENTITYLRNKNMVPAEETLELYRRLREKNSETGE